MEVRFLSRALYGIFAVITGYQERHFSRKNHTFRRLVVPGDVPCITHDVTARQAGHLAIRSIWRQLEGSADQNRIKLSSVS